MDISELPPPDENGRIVLHPPGRSRSLVVQYPLGLGLILGDLLWIWLASRSEAYPWIFLAFSLPFLVWSGYLAFSPYQVTLDDAGITAGVKGAAPKILWSQIEKIRLPTKRSRGVLVTRKVWGGKGVRSVGVYVVALPPLTTEATATLILTQAQKCNASVKEIDYDTEVNDSSSPPSLFVIGLVLVVVTFFSWKIGFLGGR